MPHGRFPRNFILPALLFVIAAVVFLPALRDGFTNWDDDKYVTSNPAVRNLGPANLLRIFTRSYVGAYVPLTIVSFALDYRFFRFRPLPYHAANVLLHALNCLLVFWFIRRFSGRSWPAFIGALFFGVHPLRVESVAWITERKDVLYLFFFLSGLIGYGYYRSRGDRRFLAAAFLSFVAAVLAKPVAVVMPLVLLLIDYADRRPGLRTALVEKIPFFAVSLASGALAILAQQSARTLRLERLPRILPNLQAAASNLWFYVSKTALPVKLSAFYPAPAATATGWPAAPALAALALTALMLYLLHRVDRRIVFGILFFLIGLLPVLQLVPTGQPLADRYTYLASIGLSCLLSLVLTPPGKILPRIVSAALIMVGVLFAAISWQRCGVWRDSLTLWNDVLAKYPNAGVAYNNRGRYFQDRNDLSLALADFDRAIAADPGYALAYYNRGVVRFTMDQYGLSLADFNRSAEIDPGFEKTFNNRGLIFYLRGETDRALRDFDRALELNPEYAGAYNNRGLIRQDQGRHDQAILDFDRALAIDPGFIDARVNRAHSLIRLGRYGSARDDARKLRALDYQDDPELNALLEGLDYLK